MSSAAAKALLGDLINLALNEHTSKDRLHAVAREFREECETLRAPIEVQVRLPVRKN